MHASPGWPGVGLADEVVAALLQFVAQESVDRATVVLVRRVDRAQDVARDIVAAQQLPAPHHPVKRTSTKTIDPVTVMQCARAVDAQANKKSVLLQKLAPVFVDQRAIGLDAVLDSLARSAVLLDQLNRVREERQNFDPAGHYSRPDVTQLTVNRGRQSTLRYEDSSG